MIMKLGIGDVVKINDGSYAVLLDSYEERSSIGFSKDNFEVIRISPNGFKSGFTEVDVHDIHIRNTRTGEIYLHSSSFVSKVDVRYQWHQAVANKKTILGYKEWLRLQP